MAELLIVENPSSSRGRRVAAALRRHLDTAGRRMEAQWIPVDRLAEAEPPDGRVLAVGGDGTVNAVASWIRNRAVNSPVGLIPAGTGNNLAQGLGIPLSTEEACRLAISSERTVDVDVVLYTVAGERSPRLIVQSGALGFPARIAACYDRLRQNPLFRALAKPMGTHIYRQLAMLGICGQKWRELSGVPPLNLRCELDAEVIQENVLAFFIGNEKSMGGAVLPCPLATTDDGKVDICLVRAGTGRSYMRILQRVRRGEHLNLEDCVVYRQTSKPLELRLSEASPLVADGDLWVSGDSYHVAVAPRCFRVVVGGGEKGRME